MSLSFLSSDYIHLPTYGCHEQRAEPRLAPQITLVPPISKSSFPGIHTLAIARNGFRNCLWVAPWHPAPLPNLFFDFVKHVKGTSLVCFYQPIIGQYSPFKLMTAPVDEEFPTAKRDALWSMVQSALDELPPLVYTEPVNHTLL